MSEFVVPRKGDLVRVQKDGVASLFIVTDVHEWGDGRIDLELLGDPENGEVDREC